MKIWLRRGDVCDIPIGRDDTGGPLYVFSIGMGYTGEKFAKILDRKLQKLEENDRFFMNGHFHRANQKIIEPIDAGKLAGFESANRKIHLCTE